MTISKNYPRIVEAIEIEDMEAIDALTIKNIDLRGFKSFRGAEKIPADYIPKIDQEIAFLFHGFREPHPSPMFIRPAFHTAVYVAYPEESGSVSYSVFGVSTGFFSENERVTERHFVKRENGDDLDQMLVNGFFRWMLWNYENGNWDYMPVHANDTDIINRRRNNRDAGFGKGFVPPIPQPLKATWKKVA